MATKKKPVAVKRGVSPFVGSLADTVMVDVTQAHMFSCVGRTRSPFGRVGDWPTLDDALSSRSRRVLAELGESRWSAAGGVLGPDGQPTCLLTSPLATAAVREAADRPGGVLWTDATGLVWAVRLVPVAGLQDGPYFGFAVGGLPADPRGKRAGSPARSVASARRRLQAGGAHLWLGPRAEQVLWAVHLAVVAQRRSVVLLPDVLLGQAVWGGGPLAAQRPGHSPSADGTTSPTPISMPGGDAQNGWVHTADSQKGFWRPAATRLIGKKRGAVAPPARRRDRSRAGDNRPSEH
jgi:hypothetical protein